MNLQQRDTACGALPSSSQIWVGGYLYLSALRALKTKRDTCVSWRCGAVRAQRAARTCALRECTGRAARARGSRAQNPSSHHQADGKPHARQLAMRGAAGRARARAARTCALRAGTGRAARVPGAARARHRRQASLRTHPKQYIPIPETLGHTVSLWSSG